MNTYSPDYLKVLNDYPENFARFITRVPGVPTSTDRQAVISALTPTHEAVLKEGGIATKMLRRAQQVHGNKAAWHVGQGIGNTAVMIHKAGNAHTHSLHIGIFCNQRLQSLSYLLENSFRSHKILRTHRLSPGNQLSTAYNSNLNGGSPHINTNAQIILCHMHHMLPYLRGKEKRKMRAFRFCLAFAAQVSPPRAQLP